MGKLPDLAEMMQERGVDVDPSTIMHWFRVGTAVAIGNGLITPPNRLT